MYPAETSSSDAVLNIIPSKGTLSHFVRREIMWKPDLLNNILVHALQSFLCSSRFWAQTLGSLSYSLFR